MRWQLPSVATRGRVTRRAEGEVKEASHHASAGVVAGRAFASCSRAKKMLAPPNIAPTPSVGMAGSLSLDVMSFAEARHAELLAVASLMPPPQKITAAAIARPARQQERLLRRRGGSNTVWRWRTRRPVPSDARQRLLGHSRRDRRRGILLRLRAAESGGLETEAWHAKRFEMVRLFGLRLPWRGRDRASI